jgi:hypothetical protein
MDSNAMADRDNCCSHTIYDEFLYMMFLLLVIYITKTKDTNNFGKVKVILLP